MYLAPRVSKIVKYVMPWGEIFKRVFAPTRQARAYATVAFGSVGAFAQVDAYASFKKLASGGVV
jgi:hypothetical protein